jgi:hypothetical protein
MESKRFERVIFILLRVFGILGIIGTFLGKDGSYSKEGLIALKHGTIIGNIFMISPVVLIEMVVSIAIYLIIIRLVQKHVSISWKNS